jgi:hypothetical protein
LSYPGVYNDGIRVSSGVAILHANSNGTPGIYYLNGQKGVQISGTSTVTTAFGETAGILIYNNWSNGSDAISVSGKGIINIIPPASGPYRGISIFSEARRALQSSPPSNDQRERNHHCGGDHLCRLRAGVPAGWFCPQYEGRPDHRRHHQRQRIGPNQRQSGLLSPPATSAISDWSNSRASTG